MSKLPLREALFTFYGDKYPNLDGHIEFLDENGSTTRKLFFQLKGTENDISYYDCDITFLNYCYRAAEPTFLIFANIPQEKVYWEHIDQTYILSALGIRDIASFAQQSKRITFLEERIINQNTPVLIDICKRHYQENLSGLTETARDAKTQQVSVAQQKVQLLEQQEQVPSFEEVRKKFAHSITNLEERLVLYHAFVYALRPFFLDQRGEKKRRKLLRYLGITDAEERFVIENLVKANLLGRTGELIYVIEKQDAISTLNHFTDIDRVNLEEVTKLFSEYDQDR